MEDEKKYSIAFNNKIYWFHCSDGEEHVNELKKKLRGVVDALSTNDFPHTLSDYGMKIAILLADEVVRTEARLRRQKEELALALPAMLKKLNAVLGDSS